MVELGARAAPDGWFVDFPDERVFGEIYEYPAINASIRRRPPADITVVGSSRAREAVLLPALAEELRKHSRSPQEIRSYAAGGAEVDTVGALVDRLLAEHKLPPVIVYPVTARQIRRRDKPDSWRTLFMTRQTLRQDIDRNGLPADEELVPIIGKALPLRLLDLRPGARYRVFRPDPLASKRPVRDNPVRGGLTFGQRETLSGVHPRTLENQPPPRRAVRAVVDTLYPDRARPLGERETARLAQVVRDVRAAGSTIIGIEVPVSALLESEYPPQMVERARVAFAAIFGKDWLPITDHPAPYVDRDFFEESHLRGQGAEKFTAVIAPFILTRIDRRDPKRSPRP